MILPTRLGCSLFIKSNIDFPPYPTTKTGWGGVKKKAEVTPRPSRRTPRTEYHPVIAAAMRTPKITSRTSRPRIAGSLSQTQERWFLIELWGSRCIVTPPVERELKGTKLSF